MRTLMISLLAAALTAAPALASSGIVREQVPYDTNADGVADLQLVFIDDFSETEGFGHADGQWDNFFFDKNLDGTWQFTEERLGYTSQLEVTVRGGEGSPIVVDVVHCRPTGPGTFEEVDARYFARDFNGDGDTADAAPAPRRGEVHLLSERVTGSCTPGS